MKQTKKKSAKAGVVTYFTTWVFSFLLMLIAVVGVVICTVCNSKYLQNQILTSKFCAITLEELNENYTSYGNAGNIPAEVMTSIITQDQIQQDMFKAVERLYGGDRTAIQHPEVAEKAKEVILANLEERGVTVTDEIQKGVEDVATGCQEDYDKYVQIFLAAYIAPYITKISTMAWLAMGVLFFTALVAFFIVINLQRATPARLRWCMNAFSAAGLFCIVLPVVFYCSVNMHQLGIEPKTLRLLLACYTNGVMNSFFYFALIYFIVVGALTIAWRRGLKRYRQVCREQKEHRI